MAGRKRIEPDLSQPVVGRFYHFAILWAGSYPGIRFDSEGSARWFVRQNREALVRHKALVLDAGRWLVNPERFVAVREEVGGARAEARLASAQA